MIWQETLKEEKGILFSYLLLSSLPSWHSDVNVLHLPPPQPPLEYDTKIQKDAQLYKWYDRIILDHCYPSQAAKVYVQHTLPDHWPRNKTGWKGRHGHGGCREVSILVVWKASVELFIQNRTFPFLHFINYNNCDLRRQQSSRKFGLNRH